MRITQIDHTASDRFCTEIPTLEKNGCLAKLGGRGGDIADDLYAPLQSHGLRRSKLQMG